MTIYTQFEMNNLIKSIILSQNELNNENQVANHLIELPTNSMNYSSNSPVEGGVAHLWETAERPRTFPIPFPSRWRKKEKAERDWTGPHSRKFRIFPYFRDGKK
jgi:hypothetical protein